MMLLLLETSRPSLRLEPEHLLRRSLPDAPGAVSELVVLYLTN